MRLLYLLLSEVSSVCLLSSKHLPRHTRCASSVCLDSFVDFVCDGNRVDTVDRKSVV